MSNVTLSVKTQDSAGITYGDPAKPDTTVRFRSTSAVKNLNGVNATNYLTEIIANDNNSVEIGGVPAQDALSVRIRISGTLESKARLRVLLTSLAAQCGQWETENVMQGFRPATAPVLVIP